MAIVDDFKARFPEFDAVAVDTYVPILEDIYPCYYCGNYDGNKCDKEIILNILAHLLLSEVNQSSAPNKSVTSKSADGLSASYAEYASSTSMIEKFFSTSKYGQRYLMLTANRIGGFCV